jgi:hypothetical protein
VILGMQKPVGQLKIESRIGHPFRVSAEASCRYRYGSPMSAATCSHRIFPIGCFNKQSALKSDLHHRDKVRVANDVAEACSKEAEVCRAAAQLVATRPLD